MRIERLVHERSELDRREMRCPNTRSAPARNGRRSGKSLAKPEAEQAKQDEEISARVATSLGRGREGVPVRHQEDGKKIASCRAFDGRSWQLSPTTSGVFGPDYTNGACPGCTSPATSSTAGLVHPEPPRRHCLFPRGRRSSGWTAYKERMGWEFPTFHLRHRLRLRLRPGTRRRSSRGSAEPSS
jgi:hypothetical protein